MSAMKEAIKSHLVWNKQHNSVAQNYERASSTQTVCSQKQLRIFRVNNSNPHNPKPKLKQSQVEQNSKLKLLIGRAGGNSTAWANQ